MDIALVPIGNMLTGGGHRLRSIDGLSVLLLSLSNQQAGSEEATSPWPLVLNSRHKNHHLNMFLNSRKDYKSTLCSANAWKPRYCLEKVTKFSLCCTCVSSCPQWNIPSLSWWKWIRGKSNVKYPKLEKRKLGPELATHWLGSRWVDSEHIPALPFLPLQRPHLHCRAENRMQQSTGWRAGEGSCLS